MWWKTGKFVLRVFSVFWMAAVGGILGSNLLAVIASLFLVPENKGVYVQPWAHAGWYAGTLLFFIGAASGRLKFINGSGFGGGSSRALPQTISAEADPIVEKPDEPQDNQNSFLNGVVVGGLVGGGLGLLLGANLLIFWFSLAYSPFAPKPVVSSVEVVQERQPGSVFKRPVMRSSHPVSLYICLTPAVVGACAGAIALGVISLKYSGEAGS